MDDKQHALAVLVSGQLVRFFREGLSPLARLSPPVDAHIVLARTEYTRAGSSAAVSPEPSLNHLSESALAERLQAMGFRHASARILSESVLDAEIRAIDAAVMEAEPDLWRATAALREQTVHGNINRWLHNGRMLYARHLAFVAALRAEVTMTTRYERFLCVREDNAFLRPEQPLPIEASTLSSSHPHHKLAHGTVLLDTHCSFLGAPSDKISLSDRMGALTLFGTNKTSHIELLIAWLRDGLAQSRSGSRDAMQSEGFLYRHLKAAKRIKVVRVPFERTDLRFESGATASATRACVRPLYYECGPSSLRTRKQWPLCEPLTKHEREIWNNL